MKDERAENTPIPPQAKPITQGIFGAAFGAVFHLLLHTAMNFVSVQKRPVDFGKTAEFGLNTGLVSFLMGMANATPNTSLTKSSSHFPDQDPGALESADYDTIRPNPSSTKCWVDKQTFVRKQLDRIR